VRPEKWHDPRDAVLTLRYLGLSLIATSLLVLGVVGRFMPDLLNFLGDEIQVIAKREWLTHLVLGVAIGLVNALLVFRESRRGRRGA